MLAGSMLREADTQAWLISSFSEFKNLLGEKKKKNTNLHILKERGCCGCENQVEAVCPLQTS